MLAQELFYFWLELWRESNFSRMNLRDKTRDKNLFFHLRYRLNFPRVTLRANFQQRVLGKLVAVISIGNIEITFFQASNSNKRKPTLSWRINLSNAIPPLDSLQFDIDYRLLVEPKERCFANKIEKSTVSVQRAYGDECVFRLP